jgi:hypothetical protein
VRKAATCHVRHGQQVRGTELGFRLNNGGGTGLAISQSLVAMLLAKKDDSSTIAKELLYFFETPASHDANHKSENIISITKLNLRRSPDLCNLW